MSGNELIGRMNINLEGRRNLLVARSAERRTNVRKSAGLWSEIEKLMRQMVDLDIADNLKLWVHNGLVKTRTSGSDLYVLKAYDISGEENDAVQATEANQPELVSDGMEFDGSDDYLEGTAPGTITANSCSISCWIKFNSYSGVSVAYNIGPNTTSHGIVFGCVFASVYEGMMASLGTSAPSPIGSKSKYADTGLPTEGEWGFYVITSSGSSITNIYINEIDRTKTSGNRLVLTTNNNYCLGARYNDSVTSFINGGVSDLRLFDKVLTSTEISAIYNQTKGFYGIT